MSASTACPLSTTSPSKAVSEKDFDGFQLFTNSTEEGTEQSGPGWRISPQPLTLSTAQWAQLQAMGPMLLQFQTACDTLYKESIKGRQPTWVADLYDQGKPEALLELSRSKRFKKAQPCVIRPDLLMTDTGFALCELDSVPGGMGFTSALNQIYRQAGFTVTESPDGMPNAFARLLKSLVPKVEAPCVAIVMSDDAGDYLQELAWLTQAVREQSGLNIHLVNVKELSLQHDAELGRERLVFRDSDGQLQAIDLVYRFFELFSMPAMQQVELLQFAVKRGLVTCTPPMKPNLEEKLSLTLLHHPALRTFWEKELGAATFTSLLSIIPQGWVVDPADLPPQAFIPGLQAQDQPIQSFQALSQATQKERQLVLKPSGFSPLSWGSRGVTIGHDRSTTEWTDALDEALSSFGTVPYVLQRFEKPAALDLCQIDEATGTAQPFKGRVRLCPYYYVIDGQVELVGVLATLCPADKKIIHGMKVAMMTPCQVQAS